MSKPSDPDSMAQAIATCYRLAAILNIPIEDAVTIYMKCVNALVASAGKKTN